jgi:hypothetical protein
VTAEGDYPKRARRRREAAAVGDSDEGYHGVDPVHTFIARSAIISCETGGLSSRAFSITLAARAAILN